MKRPRAKILLVVACSLSIGCTIPLRTSLENAVKDFQKPKPEYSFESGSGIAADTALTIIFTDPIDTSTLVLAGSMAAESDGGSWSEGSSTNDTLTILPKTEWSRGSGKTLTIECADLDGYAADRIELVYGVLDGVVYVHGVKGSDENPGTSDLPKKSIQTAIDTAAAVYTSAEVHVAEATYMPTDPIQMKGGVSLYGGYSPDDWADRESDPTWATGGSLASDHPTVLNSSATEAILIQNTTRPVTIDGFSIRCSCGIFCKNASDVAIQSNDIDGDGSDICTGITISACGACTVQRNNIRGSILGSSCAIMASTSSPTIRENTISGGKSGTNGFTVGIYLIGGSPEISKNMIYGGDAYSTSIAIFMQDGAAPIIFNNIVDGGTTAAASVTGISVDGSSPIMRNNTICSGSVTDGTADQGEEGITCINGAHATIDNNMIFTYGGAGEQKMYGMTAMTNSTPTDLRNNYFFNCLDGEYSDISLSYTEQPLNPIGSGNVSDAGSTTADVFAATVSGVVTDWHLGASAPLAARAGALDGSSLGWGYTDDLDGQSRGSSWSMGAYQFP